MEFDENNKRCKEDITELNVKLDKMIEENKNRTERNTHLETEVDRLGRNIAAITEEKNTFSEDNNQIKEYNEQLKGDGEVEK